MAAKSGDIVNTMEVGAQESNQEEELLPSPFPNGIQVRRQSTKIVRKRRSSLKGPLRALRLCVLTMMLPAILVAVPLYMRYHVYGDQIYPVGMSDMRLLDSRVSTTWCQRQVVKANATFNAFLLPELPQMQLEPVHLAMKRDLWLEDDTKEYWAFYLLKGSSITVSTCVGGPGASLIVIRGHKHLHDCAYIGDDSSEEAEETKRMLEEKYEHHHVHHHHRSFNSSAARSNEPLTMRRAGPGIVFHGGASPLSSQERLVIHDSSDTEESAGDVMEHILKKVAQARIKSSPDLPPKSRVTSLTETKEEQFSEASTRDTIIQKQRIPVTLKENSDVDGFQKNEQNNKESGQTNSSNSTDVTQSVSDNVDQQKSAEKESLSGSGSLSSSEVFEDVLKKLQKLGSRGTAVLRRLNEKLEENKDGDPKDDDLNSLRKLIKDILAEEEQNDSPKRRTRQQKGRKRKKNIQNERTGKARERRQIALSGFLKTFGEHDEDGDAAIENMEADGIADHHDTVNETTKGDVSKSEFWSSFSSSEEALLNCVGLILNLPLTPNRRCRPHQESHMLRDISLANTLTYRVQRNGYYFFVFSSENEVERNYIHTHFMLEKMVYNVSNSMDSCRNSTDQCALSLDFFSSEKVVLEVPVPPNETLWNEEFIVVSTCEPRTALYLSCVIAVPLLIVVFAFH